MALFKNKPLLDIFLESDLNTTKSESNKTPIDASKIDYSYDTTGLPELREKGEYWGNSRKSLLDFQVAGTSVFLDREIADIKRIGNFMKSPTGLLFNTKQAGLYLMNPKSETLLGLANERRIYNPAKFLMNVAGKSIGLHIENHGLISDGNYYDIMKINNNDDNYKLQNRLLQVYRERGYDKAEEMGGVAEAQNSKENNSFLKKIKAQGGLDELLKLIPQNKFISFIATDRTLKTISGFGGPKSIYGLGTTLIRTAEPINQAEQHLDNGDVIYLEDESSKKYSVYDRLYVAGGEQPGFSSVAGGETMTIQNLQGYNTYQSLSEMAEKKWNNFESKKFKDNFVDKFQTVYSTYDSNLTYNENWNYFKRLGIPEVGSGDTDVIYGNVDKGLDGVDDSQDFVKLIIGGIQFRCTIEGLTYSFDPSWTDTKYIGRADDVKVYEGLKRTINFNFIVAATSEKEMRGIYLKLNRLAQLVSPDISDSGLMNGKVVDLKLGNLLSDNSKTNTLPVVITSLSYDIDANYPWDIIMELPMIVKVTISFDVIGNKSPNSKNIYIASSHWNNFNTTDSSQTSFNSEKSEKENFDKENEFEFKEGESKIKNVNLNKF